MQKSLCWPAAVRCAPARVLGLYCLGVLAIGLLLQPAGLAAELTVEDFKFDGPLGSQGAKIEKLGKNHFGVTLGHAPKHPDWANNLQFQVLRHAQGNDLRVTARFTGGTSYAFNSYTYSWSYDGKAWRPILWQKSNKEGDTLTSALVFPTFEQDTVVVGHQVPLSYEDLVAMIESWKRSAAVKVHVLGKSLEGRNLYRLEISDPQSPHPPTRRWVHYFANQHPGEHYSQWRMVGMIEWLLSDAGAEARKRFICHFVLLMSPDAPSHGWYRVNAQGLDMNRSYSARGANEGQGHEPFIFQRDLEALMASDCPATSIWSMHTWPGPADPAMIPGPETDNGIGPITRFAEILKRNDPEHKLVKPLKLDDRRRKRTKPWTPPGPNARPIEPGGGAAWNSGPHHQFGVSAVLCEGGGGLKTKQENLDSGVVIIKSMAEYYRGLKPAAGNSEPAKP